MKPHVIARWFGRSMATVLLCGWIATAATDPTAWPEITRECRPWAYNWWMGNAVDKENLAREIKRYRDGGLGGIHIVPIYGVKGAESRFIEYLSPQWMEMMEFAVKEGERQGLGVDMTTGTGWCFGGPHISKEQGGWRMQTKVMDVAAGGKCSERFDPKSLQALVAVATDGQRVDLTNKLNERGNVSWDTAGKAWKVYALTAAPGGPNVKRSSPGGAGPMINPLDPAAMKQFLGRFTDAFAKYQGPHPRAMYHDSYEYNSSWIPGFLEVFAKRRGYRLEQHLEAFSDLSQKTEATGRVRHDYRETISDLMVEDVFPQWVQWSKERGFITRNEAHGAPGNLLDLYALADIPETEMFGRGTRDPLKSGFDERFGEGDRNPLISKFASSAAHVAGKKRTASESATWMAEHFCETLEELKCFMDLLMCSGVNHIFYHGTCYSPDDAAWPGWLFYASTEMNPRNAIWHDVPALNNYLARCQSVLQSGQPDNDVLLYWPIHDLWQNQPGGVMHLTVHSQTWLENQPLGQTAHTLWNRGYGFDYISDRLLAGTHVENGRIISGGNSFQVVLAPPVEFIPVETMQKLLALANDGATVVFENQLPKDVPGLTQLEERRARFKQMLQPLALATGGDAARKVRVGKGRVIVGALESALKLAGIQRETLVDHAGALFIRRSHADGRNYFIANQSTKPMTGWQSLSSEAASAALLDPLTGQTGMVEIKRAPDSRPMVWLNLAPGHSIIVRTFKQAPAQAAPAKFYAVENLVASITGPWQVRFVQGGPALPKAYQADRLASWTANGDPQTEAFAGSAAYTTTFDAPAGTGPWVLDLGRVCHSARVRLNGLDLGTLLMNPYRITVTNLKPQGNQLEIEVTNLSANRLRDLDRRKVPWRIFHDINLVNINYKPFDASVWPVFDSGLLGPVQLYSAKAWGQ